MQLPLIQIFIPTNGSRHFHHIYPERLLPFASPLVFRQTGLTIIQLAERKVPPWGCTIETKQNLFVGIHYIHQTLSHYGNQYLLARRSQRMKKNTLRSSAHGQTLGSLILLKRNRQLPRLPEEPPHFENISHHNTRRSDEECV